MASFMSTPEEISNAIRVISALPPDSDLPHEQLQEAMAALIRIFGARADADRKLLPVAGPNSCTATDAMLTVTTLMRALNLQFFELGLWQALPARH
jgi:hypothetical protein